MLSGRLARSVLALVAALLLCGPTASQTEVLKHTLTGDYTMHYDGYNTMTTTPSEPKFDNDPSEIKRTMAATAVHIGSDRVYVYGSTMSTNSTDNQSSLTNPFVMQVALGDTPAVLGYRELDMRSFFEFPVFAWSTKVAATADAVYIALGIYDENGYGITVVKMSPDLSTRHWTADTRKMLRRYPTESGVSLEGVCVDGNHLGVTGTYWVNHAAFGIVLQADTGRFLWDAAIESADQEGQRDQDKPAGCAVSTADNMIIFYGGSYGDMDGDGFGRGGRYRLDSYYHASRLDGTLYNRNQLNVPSPNGAHHMFIHNGQMYTVGFIGVILSPATGFTFYRSDIGSKQNSLARMILGTASDDGAMGTRMRGSYVTPQGNVIAVGTTASRIVPNEASKPNFRSVLMMTNTDLNIEYLRYESSLLGSSSQDAVACTDTVCYSAGRYVVADRTRNVVQIMRTPLCSNGSRLSNETNWGEQALTEHNSCYYCEPGHYQDEPLQYTCKECRPGSYAPTRGHGTCLLCDAGHYQPNNQSSGCLTCGKGYYSGVGASNCTVCPAGWYGDVTGASQCTPCPAGSASPDVGAITSAVCQQCDIGTYQPNTGQSSCLPAPRGYYSNTTGAVKVFPCGIGTALNATNSVTAAACVGCAPGTYAPTEGMALCSPCPLGQWNNATNATSCFDCPAFTQGNETGLTECYACPPGTANTQTGQKFCPECARGTYQPGYGSSECMNCPVNTFSPVEGASTCFDCPEHSSTLSATASDSMFSCVCDEGYFGLPGLGRRCQECPLGATCKSSDRYPRMDPGQWQDTSDVNTIYSCHPRDACPGGAPPLPEPNVTAAVTHPDEVVLKWIGVEGMQTLAVESFGYATESILGMSTDSYTTSCEVGYTDEACSLCDDGYYRSKGKCIECGIETPFDSAAVMSIYIVVWLIILALLALGVLLAGGWAGTMAVVVDEHRKKIMQLLSSEESAESAAEVRMLAAHGVVARQTDADDTILSGGGRTEGLFEGVEVASQCESLAQATVVKKQKSLTKVVDTLMRPGDAEPVGSDSEATGEDPEGPSRFRLVRWAVRIKEYIMGVIECIVDFIDRNFGMAQPVRDQDAAYVLERRSLVARVKSVIAKLIRFGQLSSVILNIKITWPSALVSLGSALQMANFDTNDVISYQCVTGADAAEAYLARYYARILLPLALLIPALVYALVVGLSGMVLKYCIRREARRTRKKVTRRSETPDPDSGVAQAPPSTSLVWWSRVFRTMEASTDAFVMIFLVLSTYAFTTFHVAVVEIFTCAERVSGMFYLAAEPGVQCFTAGTWMKLLPVSLIGFVLLSLGTPLVLALIIFGRHHKRDSITVQKRYSFLWSSFRDDKYWYMLVIIFFNWVVVMMMPLSLMSSGDQLAAMLFVLILFFLVQQLWLPYKIPSDNTMEVALLTTLILLDLVGIVFYTNDSDSDGGMSAIGKDFLGYLMVVVIVATVLYFVYTLAGGQVISIRLARRWRRRGHGKQAKRDFLVACVEGELEMVKPNTSGPGEWMSAYVSEEASAPEDLQSLVVHMPPNVHWLGDGDVGQAVFVPAVYVDCLKQILAMAPADDGGGTESHLEEGGGTECAECVLVGEPRAGKSMFVAFLCGVGLGGLPGLPEGAVDVVYVQTRSRVVVYHASRRRMKVFHGPSALHKAGLAVGKHSHNRGTVARRGLHIVDRDSGPSVRTSPPGTILRVRTLRPADADFEDMRTLAYGSSPDGSLSRAVYLRPWSLHDILLWCQFVASSRTDEPAAFIDILRSWMTQGGRVPDPELSLKKTRDKLRSQVAKLGVGMNDGALDATSSSADLASFLNNMFCTAPDLWSFENVASMTRGRSGRVGVVMRSQVVCNEVTSQATGEGVDVDVVARMVDGMARLADLDNTNGMMESLLLCGLQRQLMFALVNKSVPRGATFFIFNEQARERFQHKVKRLLTRQHLAENSPRIILPPMARKVFVLDSSAVRSPAGDLHGPQNPPLEPHLYYQVVDSHDEAAAGDLALQRAGRTSMVNGFCMFPVKKKEPAKLVVFMLASSVSSSPALQVHERQVARIVEEVDLQWAALAPMMNPGAFAASSKAESRKSRGLKRFFTKKDVGSASPSIASTQPDGHNGPPGHNRSPSSLSDCSETSTTELLETRQLSLLGPQDRAPTLKAMSALQLSSPALLAHSRPVRGDESQLPFEVHVYHVATPGQASSGLVHSNGNLPSKVHLERGVEFGVSHHLVGLSSVEEPVEDIE